MVAGVDVEALESCGADGVCAILALADFLFPVLLSAVFLVLASALRVPFLGPVHLVVPCLAFHPQ